MNKQPGNKILIIVIGILLATNIVLLCLFLFNKPEKKPDRKAVMGAYLKSEIGFSDQQMVQFDTIKAQHRRQVKALFEEIKARKGNSFKALVAENFSDSAIIRAAADAAQKQQGVELVMLRHLKDIRNLCTAEQQKKFDTGFYKVMMRPREDKMKSEK